jgi:hypothetical protein
MARRTRGWHLLRLKIVNAESLGASSLASVLSGLNSTSSPGRLHSNHRFLGRPPFLPHPESFLRCFIVVVVPPFLPMQRGQIIRVRGWRGQYVAMARIFRSGNFLCQAGGWLFFLPLPPFFPHSDNCILCLPAVVRPPLDAMQRGQLSFVPACLGQVGARELTASTSWFETSRRNSAC